MEQLQPEGGMMLQRQNNRHLLKETKNGMEKKRVQKLEVHSISTLGAKMRTQVSTTMVEDLSVIKKNQPNSQSSRPLSGLRHRKALHRPTLEPSQVSRVHLKDNKIIRDGAIAVRIKIHGMVSVRKED